MTILRRGLLTGGVLLTLLVVAACGGAGASPSSPPTSSPTSSPTSPAGARRFGGVDSAQFAKIRQCLQAAGIPLPTPSPRPSISPGQPRPSRSPGQRPGAGRGLFNDPQAQAALKACGIPLPSPGSFRRPGASPSPSS